MALSDWNLDANEEKGQQETVTPCKYKYVCDQYKFNLKTCNMNPMNYCTTFRNFERGGEVKKKNDKHKGDMK